VVVTRYGSFVCKGYLIDRLFKLNVVNHEVNNMSSTLLSVLNVESTNPWHGRLGHVNSQSIKRMMNLNLIPRSSINVKEKCQVCV